MILLVGLQGSGKTTAAAKLALMLRKEPTPLLVAADLQRPAAVEQLEQLGRELQIPVARRSARTPSRPRARASSRQSQGSDTVIVDTAGRLQIDDELMDELERIASDDARNVLLVLDAMTGQDAVNVARGVPGADRVRRGHADEARRRRARRRGASVRAVTGKPSSSPRSARSSTSSRGSTPSGWPRGSWAWATS